MEQRQGQVAMFRPKFRFLGVDDDVTTCDCCGRRNLKFTAVLEVLDVDGNGTGEIVRYGRECAARATGWGYKLIDKKLKKAVEERAEAAAMEAYRRERDALRARAIEHAKKVAAELEARSKAAGHYVDPFGGDHEARRRCIQWIQLQYVGGSDWSEAIQAVGGLRMAFGIWDYFGRPAYKGL